MKLTSRQALERLREGNRRFVNGVISLEALMSHAQARRSQAAQVQEPFAVVLGCSDSRAPAEIVFDQGLGDLFVIRVAGNIAAPSQIASVEFAVERFGVPLVVVLGHSNCGAVIATLDCISRDQPASPGLRAIVDRIRPGLLALNEQAFGIEDPDLVEHAVRVNVRATLQTLRGGSAVLESRLLKGELLIVGAEYNLASGEVDFFEVPGEEPGLSTP